MVLAIVLVVAAALVAVIVFRSRSWKTLATGNGRAAEDVQAKYAFLKANQVKCKLRTEESAAMGAVQGGGSYSAPSSNVKLDVHKKDLDRATELMAAFDKDNAFTQY